MRKKRIYIMLGNNIDIVQQENLSNGVILRNEGSRAITLPGHFARCFTKFSMTNYVFGQQLYYFLILISTTMKKLFETVKAWLRSRVTAMKSE